MTPTTCPACGYDLAKGRDHLCIPDDEHAPDHTNPKYTIGHYASHPTPPAPDEPKKEYFGRTEYMSGANGKRKLAWAIYEGKERDAARAEAERLEGALSFRIDWCQRLTAALERAEDVIRECVERVKTPDASALAEIERIRNGN